MVLLVCAVLLVLVAVVTLVVLVLALVLVVWMTTTGVPEPLCATPCLFFRVRWALVTFWHHELLAQNEVRSVAHDHIFPHDRVDYDYSVVTVGAALCCIVTPRILYSSRIVFFVHS